MRAEVHGTGPERCRAASVPDKQRSIAGLSYRMLQINILSSHVKPYELRKLDDTVQLWASPPNISPKPSTPGQQTLIRAASSLVPQVISWGLKDSSRKALGLERRISLLLFATDLPVDLGTA